MTTTPGTDNGHRPWRKPRRSQVNGHCVETASWRTPQRSMSGGACVETGHGPGIVAVRDSKNRAAGHLEFPAAAWAAFTSNLKETP